MSFFRKCAMTAGLMCAASAAQAQYYPYAAPATLPAPTQSRQLAYQNWATYNDQAESVPAPTPAPGGGVEALQGNGHHYDDALAGNGWGGHGGDGCCEDDCCNWCGGGQGLLNPCGPRWYGGVAGLYLERNKPNPYQLSFDTTNPVGELILNTHTLEDGEVGFEVTVGRYIGCSCALQLTYWTLDNFSGEATAYDPAGVGSLNTPIDFRSLAFDVGGVASPVNDWYDSAQAHRLTREDELHSAEINFVHYPMLGHCGHFSANLFGGVRWFRFREGWSFDTADGDPTFGVDLANEAYYRIHTENDLVGLQVGGRVDYCFGKRCSVFATPRFGVFWNNMEQHSSITSGDGLVALDITSNRDVCSFLGQLDLGVNYQITHTCSAYVGYRVVAISGIALADEQVPYLQDDLFGIADVDHNSNLVLHGAMAGVRFNF